MPTKKSTTKKTKKATPAKKKTTSTKKVAKRTTVSKPQHNGCGTITIIGLIALVICVFIAGGMAIYSAIDNYKAITRISDFSIIEKTDTYSTIAMNDEYLEVAVSDWGNPATEYQAKVELSTGNAKVVVHKDGSDDVTYQGNLDEDTLTQITNSAKAILGSSTKTTLGAGEYTYNDALIDICQSIINDFKEK